MFEYADVLINVSMKTLDVFKGHPNLELFFVMMVYPLVLNVLQYWVQDHFLKGTDFIEEQRMTARLSAQQTMKHESSKFITENGFIDFQKNMEEYR